jgi:transposase
MAKPLLPEEVWQLVQPLLPPRPKSPKGGRPALHDRDALRGILFVLKHSIAWPDLPDELGWGCGMTCLRRLREWQRAAVWKDIEAVLKKNLPRGDSIDWARTSIGSYQMLSKQRPRRFAQSARVSGQQRAV